MKVTPVYLQAEKLFASLGYSLPKTLELLARNPQSVVYHCPQVLLLGLIVNVEDSVEQITDLDFVSSKEIPPENRGLYLYHLESTHQGNVFSCLKYFFLLLKEKKKIRWVCFERLKDPQKTLKIYPLDLFSQRCLGLESLAKAKADI